MASKTEEGGAEVVPQAVYEVNLEIDPDAVEGFMAWLHPHVGEMLEIDGFLDARISAVEGDAENGRKRFVCHYTLKSRAHLQEYFDVHAARMRGDGLTRFKDKFVAERRVLTVQAAMTAHAKPASE